MPLEEADVPPPAPVSLELAPSLDFEASPPVLLSSADEPADEPSPLVAVVEVEVVDVEVVSVASFSAEVSVGGVMSGVLLGTASETLLAPHELRPTPQMSTSRLAPSVAMRPDLRIRLTSGAERPHPATTGRAVVQILLGELIAPWTEAQALYCPRKLRR